MVSGSSPGRVTAMTQAQMSRTRTGWCHQTASERTIHSCCGGLGHWARPVKTASRKGRRCLRTKVISRTPKPDLFCSNPTMFKCVFSSAECFGEDQGCLILPAVFFLTDTIQDQYCRTYIGSITTSHAYKWTLECKISVNECLNDPYAQQSL